MTNHIDILRNVVLFNTGETVLWTGRAKMSETDFGFDHGELPPEAIASLGSKRVIDPEALKPLNKIRYQMRRSCMEVGVRFLGGFAVPANAAETLVKKLESLVLEGEVIKGDFMQSLDRKLQIWHAAHPKWAHILSAGTPERESIAKRIQFGFHAILVTTPENDIVAKSIINAVDGMGASIIDEISSEARTFVEKSLDDGRDQGSQKTLLPMRRIAKKLAGMRYIDPQFQKITEVVDAVIDTLPLSGRVEAQDFINLTRLANLLSNRVSFGETTKNLDMGMVTVQGVVDNLTSNDICVKKVTANKSVSSIFDDIDDLPMPMPIINTEVFIQTPNPTPARAKVISAIDF